MLLGKVHLDMGPYSDGYQRKIKHVFFLISLLYLRIKLFYDGIFLIIYMFVRVFVSASCIGEFQEFSFQKSHFYYKKCLNFMVKDFNTN